MPYSSGTFSRIYDWTNEKASSPIEIAKLDEQEEDIAAGLSNCILRDGTGLPTAAQDWNGQNLTNVAAFTATGIVTGGRFVPTSSSAPTNGMYLSAANTPALASNSTVRWSVNSTGNHYFRPPSSGVAVLVNAAPGTAQVSLESGIQTGTNNPYIQFRHTESTSLSDINFTYANGGSGATLSVGNMAFMAISNSRNVTINAPSSGTALTVNGASGGNIASFASASGTDLTAQLIATGTRSWSINVATSGGRFFLYDATRGAEVLSASSVGGVTVASPSSGTGLTVAGGGAAITGDSSVTGTLTATTFSGSGASLTALNASNLSSGTVPDARFPATLPALNGSALTALNATQLTSGTVPDARFPSTLPAVSGENLTNLPAGNLTGTVASARISGSYTGITAIGASATIDGVTVGYRSIPRSTTTTTAATTDVGKCIAVTASITIPNATFAAGDALSIYNDSASSITITQGASLTLRLGGTTTTGNRTLQPRGMATIWFNTASEAIATGSGLG